MDNPGYVGLTRLQGLVDELRAVANNVANVSTTGFRAEGVVFAEVLQAAAVDGGALSMAQPRARTTDPTEGGFAATGGELDLAIAGPGYFQVATPAGNRLTRAGAFALNAERELVTMTGARVLDEGGAAIAIPAGARSIGVGEDGTISADGAPVGRIGLFDAPAESLIREDGVTFRPTGAPAPAQGSRTIQGFVEQSNVNPVDELARMIEVQRAYELGQSFLELEDARIREGVRTIGRVS
jgi:flagellar basal-body rod protein FlgF